MMIFIKQLILKRLAKIKCGPISFGPNSSIDRLCTFEGKNVVRDYTRLYDCHLGYASYVSSNCLFIQTQIGKYCSIGDNVTTATGSHPTHTFVSTHPAFFSTKCQSGFTYVNEDLFDEESSNQLSSGRSIVIGNDVWIGSCATLLGGISIGDGAIIAAGSVVTKNVAPYAIVAGVPAKQIRMRFSPAECKNLMDIQWWEKDPQWIINRASYFCDVSVFLSKAMQGQQNDK